MNRLAKAPLTLLAVISWLALMVDRAVRALLRGFGGIPLLVVVLLAGITVPLLLEGSRQQPVLQTVDDVRDGVSALTNWIRMRGRIVTLTAPEQVASGHRVQSLLIEPDSDAIMLTSEQVVDHLTEVTGELGGTFQASTVARTVGGPRFPDEELDIDEDHLVLVDNPIVPPHERNWAIVWGLAVAGGVLVVGLWIGYPVVWLRPARPPADVQPLRAGQSLSLRLVEPDDETGTRLRARRAEFRRLERREPDDPYFALASAGGELAIQFRRHMWSGASSGRLWMIADTAPVVQLRDWGIEVLLALDSEADRQRLVASFLRDDGQGDA